ncbi:hypothetical protein QBC34DRAFT_410143 [Podospora aff. communis PSN243]|uniref:Uncharacterized protein n=1 Tax=Podospora aff. communis PSN243 TaxID=3040156 RepID=A0AAV9GIJ6_9PEZI|nr:hypothetical protein QBC34DRAFT_410143 [Podospora aff. communis PSN243]
MNPGRDARVEKIRHRLREGVAIPKEEFLDFVNVYSHFHETGWKVRPALAKWIQENGDTVLTWLPDILRARPGYFEDSRSGKRASAYDEYEAMVALGLAGQASPRLPDSLEPILATASSAQPSPDPDMPPTRPKQKTISDFGTALPNSACQKRPRLLGMIQQQVWLQDITEAHKRLGAAKRWLLQVANDPPHDEWKDWLRDAAEKLIPDISDRVETAQLCLEDVKLRYQNSCAEQARNRLELSKRHFPSVEEDDDEIPTPMPTPEARFQESEDLSSIRVESDIIGTGTSTAPITPTTSRRPATGAVANSHFDPPLGSSAAGLSNPPFPRRSAMVSSTQPLNQYILSLLFGRQYYPRNLTNPPQPPHPTTARPHAAKAKRPRSSHSITSVNSVHDSDSGNDHDEPKLVAKTGRSIYSVEASDDEARPSRPKRARVAVSMGEARREQRAHTQMHFGGPGRSAYVARAETAVD